MADLLFPPPLRFPGLPEEGFRAFDIRDREERRRAIIEAFHPRLKVLGEDLVSALGRGSGEHRLHAHLPRLDWPRDYQPFCTWLALSYLGHGYQQGPQLNVGVHRDHVAVRLGWDAATDAFGRFEFLARHGGLGRQLESEASALGLRFRVYAAAPWPEGSRLVVESAHDWEAALGAASRGGVWFEVGRRWDFPEHLPWACSPGLGDEALRIFRGLLPLYERLARHEGGARPS